MKVIILLFAFLSYSTRLTKVKASDDVPSVFFSEVKDANGNLTVLEKWQQMEKKVKEIANAGVKMLLPILMDNSVKLNLSNECMRNSLHLLSGVKNIKPWAMRFLDSSAKIIDGVMVGTTSSFGAYDECLDTEVKITKLRDKKKLLFRGQYCTIDMVPPLPPKPSFYTVDNVLDELKNFSRGDTVIAEISKFIQLMYDISLKFGICVPSGCTVEDIDKIARTLGTALLFNAKASRCEVKEENNFTPLIIAVIACYSFVGFLILVGSLLDLYAYYKKIGFKNKFIRVLVAFSLFSNFRKFVDTRTSSDTLSCLNGVRFLSMTWVVIGHTYLTVNLQLLRLRDLSMSITLRSSTFSMLRITFFDDFLKSNKSQLIGDFEKARSVLKDFAFQAVLNGTFSVDTFFYIGGLLVCYVTMKQARNKSHTFTVPLYIFHRLWRIIPVYTFVVMFMFLLDLMGSGPIWHETTYRYIKACYDNWWASLLLINNFYDAEHACVPQSWYLSADFQLYVGALVILLPMIRWPKVGILLSILGITASVIYSGVGTYVNDYPYGAMPTHMDQGKLRSYFAQFYFKPFIHASPYCIGLLSGYLLAMKPDLKIPPLIQVTGWSLAFIFNFSVVYGAVEWMRGSEPSTFTGLMYASFSRTAWTLGVAWMIICCATGHGGVINCILSWKAFIPLGRLTYLAYLVHFPLQLVFIGSMKTNLQADHFLVVWIYFGHLCATYGIAFAGSMLIEAPFLSLQKIFLTRENKKETNDGSNEISQLNGSFKSMKNGDASRIVPKSGEESGGIDNGCAV